MPPAYKFAPTPGTKAFLYGAGLAYDAYKFYKSPQGQAAMSTLKSWKNNPGSFANYFRNHRVFKRRQLANRITFNSFSNRYRIGRAIYRRFRR